MKIFTQHSDSLFGSSSGSPDLSVRTSHSDEEIMLASTHPKKRAGRTKFRETRHPVYRGVRRRNNNKWVCELREPNKKSRIWLGTYPNPEMAARAHDVAALALRGHTACLNFADSAWRLPKPVSNDARDIQKAAASAAEEYRSPVSSPAPETSKSSVHGGCSSDSGIENVFYMDEEAMFNMPGLLVSMAEGLLLSPPPVAEPMAEDGGCDWGSDDVSLWSYSF